MAKIRVTDLRLRAIIGINDWEREHKQDIVINISIDYDANPSIETDHIDDTIDYKTITKEIINTIEKSEFYLLEKLADTIIKIVMKNPKAKSSSVRVDKPGALRFADSVSVELHQNRDE